MRENGHVCSLFILLARAYVPCEIISKSPFPVCSVRAAPYSPGDSVPVFNSRYIALLVIVLPVAERSVVPFRFRDSLQLVAITLAR